MSQNKKGFKPIWLAYGAVVLVFLCFGIWALRTLLFSETKPGRKMTMITLVKPPPPPPPPPEEEPPPPEVEEEEELIEPEPEPQEAMDDSSDEPPAGENLGVDAEGGAGGDSFGLVGKKGGRSLIGGGLGSSALLRKYAWYTRLLQNQVRDEMRRLLKETGGVPDGNYKVKVRIFLDDSGRVIDFRLLGSSGNERMDQALLDALPGIVLSEPPPPDMPLTMDLRISAKG
mgnify:CR=1 FL=1